MFYLLTPTKTLVMCRATARAESLLKALKADGPTEQCSNLRSAAATVRNIANEFAVFELTVSALDGDCAQTSMAPERLLRVSPGREFAPLENSAPSPISVLVVLAPASGSMALIRSPIFSSIPVRRIIVTTRADHAAQDAHHSGLVDALVYIDAENIAADIADMIRSVRSQKRDYNRERLSIVTTLLANGTTKFLRDRNVLELINKTAQTADADEILLSLEPPGILIKRDGALSKFMLICDDDYRNGLLEISALRRRELETSRSKTSRLPRTLLRSAPTNFDQHVAWARHLKGAKRIGIEGRWHYKAFTIDD